MMGNELPAEGRGYYTEEIIVLLGAPSLSHEHVPLATIV